MTNIDTSSLEASDVQEYRGYFKLVYNRETTLSHEELVSLVMSTDDDMEPKDWAEAMLNAEDTNERNGGDVTDTELENDDRSGDEPGDVNPGSWAYDAASKWDDQFIADLEKNAQAALENKRGAAVLMQDLIRLHGRGTILTTWPVPGTKQSTSANVITQKYNKTTTDTTTGETKTGTDNGDRYLDLFDASKPGRELAAKLASWKAAKAGEKGKHIFSVHAAMAADEIKLTAEKSKLDGFRTTKKNAIVRAVNTLFKQHRLSTETECEVELVTDDGKPDGVPVDSNKLFYIWNKKDRKQFRILTIGQLLALDVDKAKGAGGTYTAVIGTTGRQPGNKGKVITVPVIDKLSIFDETTSEYSAFFEKLRGDTKAMNAFLTHLNGGGSDALLLSLNAIMTDIDSYLSKPGLAKRLQGLLVDERKTANGKAA